MHYGLRHNIRMRVVAVVLAAGKGDRFGQDKTQVLLAGKPLWRWSYEAFSRHPEIDGVGLVGSQENLGSLSAGAPEAAFVVLGGETRTESSRCALDALPDTAEIVLLHDAARPFVTDDVISQVIVGAARAGAAAPGTRPTDTIKLRTNGRLATLDRNSLVAVQTPQALRIDALRKGHAALSEATDDLALAEAAGFEPEIVPGDPRNLKITTPDDLRRAAERLLGTEARTGMGYDIHALSNDPNRGLMLGGISFEGHAGLEGHSDADVLLHAIVDALLGAAGLGDIGSHFPNTDPRWKDAPSITFLNHARSLLEEQGFGIVNVDATLIAESPKIGGRSQEMKALIGEALGIEATRIGIKATTNERLGAIGRGEGMAAMAIASIRPAPL